jgi:Flp pilus assembly protein TadG
MPARTRPAATAVGGHRGQSLVEFALVLPIFVTMLMGVIEFAFVFNALLSVNFASRDAALVAAEAGNGAGADCVVLAAINAAIDAPTDERRIQQVEIYKADADGDMIGSPTVYSRTGSTTCTFVDGSTTTQPYTRIANGYAVADRCNVLGGCDASITTDSVDNIGVRITYQHQWVTPIRNFVGGGGGGLVFDRSSIMRMEPIL